ncbi:MAG TPA: NAD+ synthase, partial [Bacteroidales bacterium]|nr:NAD+ synthase [Bacteroidales bacterium]
MRIALAQINYIIGDFEYNTSRIIDAIGKAKAAHADIVIFSELCVCGYPPRDFLEFSDFIEKSMLAVQNIAKACNGIAAVVGGPSINPADKGKPLYNTAFFLADKEVIGTAHKTLLPNYDVFDEYRYFEPNRLPGQIITYRNCRFALTICEDLWNIQDDPLYLRNPMDELIKQEPDVIINIAASPFHYDQAEIRKEIYTRNARTYKLPVFYVNHTGGQTELLFDGGSMAIDTEGEVFGMLKFFEEDMQIFDLDLVKSGKAKPENISSGNQIVRVHDALVMGIRDYFSKMGLKKAVLGLSGGIDSAVTLVLAARALGSDNVKAILLPSPYSSEHSITDAVALAENLNVSYSIIPISESYSAMETTMEPYFQDLPFNLAEENMQARLRAVILMAWSNKFGHILLNTSNKSEAAVGYGTLYGDMCGGLSVLGDVYKTQVYELAAFINQKKEIIPE